MTHAIPEKFEFHIGGFGNHGYSIEFIDNHLIYHETYSNMPILRDKVIKTEPSPADWENFWQELDNLKIWKWKKSYNNPHMLDGTQWELDFVIDTKSKKISGSNNYPETFNKFETALRTLLGGMRLR